MAADTPVRILYTTRNKQILDICPLMFPFKLRYIFFIRHERQRCVHKEKYEEKNLIFKLYLHSVFSHRLLAPPLMCLDPALCVCFVTYKARLSFLSRSPCVVTCFVAVRSLNWSFCHTADGKLDSSSAFLVLPQSILSLTTVSDALLSSVTPGKGVIALRDARNREVLFPVERRKPFLDACMGFFFCFL